MKRTKEHGIEWSGEMKGREFLGILFDELVVRKADIEYVVFQNVHFKNCYLGFDSVYSKCRFVDCRFYGNIDLTTPAAFLILPIRSVVVADTGHPPPMSTSEICRLQV